MQSNKCRFNRHTWISTDADGYDLTLCRKCKVAWDYDVLSIYEKIKSRYEDMIANKIARNVYENSEPPF